MRDSQPNSFVEEWGEGRTEGTGGVKDTRKRCPEPTNLGPGAQRD